MDNLDAKPIPGTEGATNAVLFAGRPMGGVLCGAKLKKISLSGGAALPSAMP